MRANRSKARALSTVTGAHLLPRHHTSMTDQIKDDGEAMRAFWEGMGVSEDTGFRMMQDLGFMDARGSLTKLGIASIQAMLRKELGAKPS
jgi:hypothetical protein